jgi:DNA polymerase-1
MHENLLLLLDGTAIAYRAFHAVAPLNAPDGTPTNALYGFIHLFRALRAHWQPAKIVATFDGGKPADRMALCPAYKGQRKPMDEALKVQLPLIDGYLDAAGIPRVRLPHEEADDVLSTLAARAEADGKDVRIATSDKDLLQMVTPRVWCVPPTKDGKPLDPAGVVAKLGVPPEKVVSYLAMVGDTADNLPGVPGVGPKTAAKLLAVHGTLAAIREAAAAGKIEPERIGKAIREGGEVLETNEKMMTTKRDLPGLWENWEAIPLPGEPDGEGEKAFCARYGMGHLLHEMARDAARAKEEEEILAEAAAEESARAPRPQKRADKRDDSRQLTLF